ncbi:MAG: J domain-containing protein [Lachnospiraceae bacterium]|jgi:curved DNA-binding protein CbpA|nr:J domain-containing protein [Lachnospiraceae bacterium]MBO7339976.1 J domain-containing protein [Lachnospiraceae bacterium]MBP5263641.1 J domain-containing protein [Lachnospiraceae bacterium]MBP5670558.1 J domain-containing protein [Lachnospiraceae bacterium]MBR3469894.1 J domain-containing protein [Lachnospiraceae bacterium]
MKDYYKILEVSPDATDDAIKKSFRKLAKKFHPDTNGGDPKAVARFQEINEAYSVLGEADKRKAYDDERAGKKAGQGFGGAQQQGKSGTGSKAPRGTFTGFNASNFKMNFDDMMFGELNKEKEKKAKAEGNPADVSSQFASFFGFKPR